MAGFVKLKDIADALGISVVTVSNALSGKKGVSDELRDKIMAKAQILGYDKVKRVKPLGSAFTIGVIVAHRYIDVGGSFYWAMYQQTAFEAARKQNLTMLEIIGTGEEQQKELPKMLKEGSIDGLIVIGKMDVTYLKRIIDSGHVPVVLMDFFSDELTCDAVMSNNYIGMYKMTRYLLNRGHEDIAYVGEISTDENLCNRYFGYRKGLEEREISLNAKWVIDDPRLVQREAGLVLPERMPTAFVCCNDLVAGIVYDELITAGYRVPEDISVVGYDDYLYGHPFAEELTTYHVDMKAMAQTAVKILQKKIRGDRSYCGVRYLDSFIVERSSVKTIKR